MRRDLVSGVIALALGGVYLVEATKIPSSALGDTVGSAGFPLILGWIMVGTAILFLLQTAVRIRTAGAHHAPPSGEDDPRHMFQRAAGLALIAAAFIVVLPTLGYVLAVAVMLAAVMLYQGLPLALRTGLVAVGGALFLYGLFGLLLGIPVPAGPWAAIFG